MHKAINDPRAEHQRKAKAFFVRLAAKVNGADERKAAAQEKRDRKAAKRVADATASAIGDLAARESIFIADRINHGNPNADGSEFRGLL